MKNTYYTSQTTPEANPLIQYSAFFNDWTHAESNAESFEEFVDAFREPLESEDKKGPSFCPFTFEDNYRNNENATQSKLLVFDLDDLPEETTAEAVISELSKYRAFCYSTYSHRLGENGPRFRVVLLLSDYIDPRSYKQVARSFSKMHKCLAQADESGFKPTQVFFLPSVPPGQQEFFEFAESLGEPLDWKKIYTDGSKSYASQERFTTQSENVGEELIPEGRRNRTLFNHGLKLRGQGYSESEILKKLNQVNSSRCTPPLPDEEVIGIAKSASKKEVLPKFYTETITDKSIAETVLEAEDNNLIYCVDFKAWFKFNPDTGYWSECKPDLIRSLILDTLDRHKQFVRTTDLILDRDRPDHIERIEKLGYSRVVEGVMKLLPAVNYRDFNFENFDANPYLFGLANGQCLDLKTQVVRPIRQDDYLTKSSGISYEENADCPIWKRSVLEWCKGDIELANYLKQLVGYSLSGSTVDQRLYFLYGSGLNGKSVFINIISALSGQNCIGIDSSTLMTIKRDGGGASSDVVRLAGVRLATCSELPNKGMFNEAFINGFTAGDAITARPLYKNDITFRPVAKLFISGNHKPIIHSRTNGIWRRITLIPFEATIESPDTYLEFKLMAELSGIMNWAIEGWKEFQEKGKLVRPQVVEDACKEYRSEMDVLSSWLDEVVEKDATGKLYIQDLYKYYHSSFIEQGMAPMSLPAFRQELRKMYGEPIKASSGYYFKGYRFRTQG